MVYYLILFFLTVTAWSQTTPQGVEIRNVSIHGSGCERSKARASFSPDLKDLSILFDNYSVEIGEGSPNPNAKSQQKNCIINLRIKTPPDWQFAFTGIDYRGFIALPDSAWGFHKFIIQSVGTLWPAFKEVIHKGPLNEDYYYHRESLPQRKVWSRCYTDSHHFKLTSQLGVKYYPQRAADRAYAIISLDTQDLSLRQSIGVEWQACPPPNNEEPTPPSEGRAFRRRPL